VLCPKTDLLHTILYKLLLIACSILVVRAMDNKAYVLTEGAAQVPAPMGVLGVISKCCQRLWLLYPQEEENMLSCEQRGLTGSQEKL
jgi:hypothetical protein